MIHTLRIEAYNQPAVLERLLRVTRHRGFHVTNMEMNSQTEDQQLEIMVSVQSDNPIHLLENQLNKLFDVARVSIQTPAAMQCSA